MGGRVGGNADPRLHRRHVAGTGAHFHSDFVCDVARRFDDYLGIPGLGADVRRAASCVVSSPEHEGGSGLWRRKQIDDARKADEGGYSIADLESFLDGSRFHSIRAAISFSISVI